MTYAAVSFDLDSTLCEPVQDRADVLASAFDDVGVERFCTPADLRAAVPDLPTAETDREFHELLFEEVAARAGADATLAPALAEAYLEAADPTAVRFRPGAEAALAAARENGPVALVTNGGRETQTGKLERLGIADAFDAAVFVDPADGIHPKPDAAPFERALSTLTVDPADTVHVGDSLHADVAGANAMGMDSAWIDLGHDAPGAAHDPTYRLSSLEEFDAVV